MPEDPDPLRGKADSETETSGDATAEDKPEVQPAPPAPLGEYDAGPGTGQTVAQAALEDAQTDLNTSKAATEAAEAKVETAQEQLSKKEQDLNVEPPATGKRPASPFYSPDEWRLLLWTFFIGMLGGAFAKVLGFESAKAEPFYATMLSGGLAAILAVFFLARTDTDKRIHLTIFAVLCGFIGSPLVKEAVSSFGKGFGVEDKPLQSLQKSNDLVNDLKNAVETPEGKETAGRNLQEIQKNVEEAIESTVNGGASVRSAVSANVENTVSTLQQIAPSAPLETLRTVENIGVTAASNGQPKIAERALSAARHLSVSPDPATRKAAAGVMSALSLALNIKPRIHLEVATGIDQASIDQLKASVGKTGYDLIGPKRISLAEEKARVIYYDPADENEALVIVGELTKAGVQNVEPVLRPKPASFRPRHFDVELGANTLPAVSPAPR